MVTILNILSQPVNKDMALLIALVENAVILVWLLRRNIKRHA